MDHHSNRGMKHRMTKGINGIITDYPQDLICLKTLFMNQGWLLLEFDSNTGNLIHDKSGNLSNGTTYNTNWSNGLNGSSLSFNGSSSMLHLITLVHLIRYLKKLLFRLGQFKSTTFLISNSFNHFWLWSRCLHSLLG